MEYRELTRPPNSRLRPTLLCVLLLLSTILFPGPTTEGVLAKAGTEAIPDKALEDYGALRTFSEIDPTAVMVALVNPAMPGDVLEEVLPPGTEILPGSIEVWMLPPDPAVSDTSWAEPAAALIDYDPVINILTVSDGDFSAVGYQLAVPLPPTEEITGNVTQGGETKPTLEVAAVYDYLLAELTAPDAFDGLASSINSSTSSWASGVAVSSLPRVILDNDTNLDAANAGAHDNSGVASCLESGIELSSNASFLELGVLAGGKGEGFSWIGTAFYVPGCDPNKSESAMGRIELNDIVFHGCLFWAPTCIFVGPPLMIVCGAGMSSEKIDWEVRSWPVSGGSISGNGSVVYTTILSEQSPGVPFLCNPVNQFPDPLNMSTTGFNFQEDHVYMVRLLIQGRAIGVLGCGVTDFMDEADGGCTTEDGSRAGVFYDNLDVIFDLDPMADLHVDATDLDLSLTEVISGWPIDITLDVHNYGTANALDVHTKFTADAEGMCDDIYHPNPNLPDCTVIPEVEKCGGMETVDLFWCSTGVGRRGINALVDLPWQQIPEKDETNNTVTDSITVLPPPLVATALVLDKSYSMERTIYQYGPSFLDMSLWASHAWIDLNTAFHGLGVFNYGANVVQTLPLEYMDAAGKSDAHVAVENMAGVNRSGSVTWEAMDTALEALCCMATPLKALILLTDGGNTQTMPPPQAQLIAKALCCRVPIIAILPHPFRFEGGGTEPDNYPAGMFAHLQYLHEITAGTGGGMYYIPLEPDPVVVDGLMAQVLDALTHDPDPGALVNPQRQPLLAAGRTMRAGTINILPVGEGWATPLVVDVTAPPGLTFAEVPPITAPPGLVTAPPALLDENQRLQFTLDAFSPDPCSDLIGVGGDLGMLMSADFSVTEGDIVVDLDDGGAGVIATTVMVGAVGDGLSAVKPDVLTLPKVNALLDPYPNPFNPRTTIRLELSRDSDVVLKIFDVRGMLVRTLVDEPIPVGRHEWEWTGTDDSGQRVASGVYFIQVVAGDFVDYRRVALIK